MSYKKEQDRDGADGEEVLPAPKVPISFAIACIKQALLIEMQQLELSHGIQVPDWAYLSEEEKCLLGSVADTGRISADGPSRRRNPDRRLVLECKKVHNERRLDAASATRLDKPTRNV